MTSRVPRLGVRPLVVAVFAGLLSTLAAATGASAAPPAHLYVANDSNAVQAFSLDASGTPTALGTAVSSGSTSPLGVSMSPDGTHLYSVTGSFSGQAYVSSYAITNGSLSTGVTTSLGNNPTTTTDTQSQGFETAVAPDGKHLYVAVGGGNDEGVVDVLPLADGVPGTPSQSVAEPGPIGLNVSPNGKFLYVNDAGDATIHSYSIDSTTGQITAVGTPAANPNNFPPGGGITETPDNAHVYAVATNNGVGGHGTITEYAVGSDGSLTEKNAYNTLGAGPTDLAVAPSGKYLYYANQCPAVDQNNPTATVGCSPPVKSTVGAYTINQDGTLTANGIQPTGGLGTYAIAAAPDGKHVYATDFYGVSGGNQPPGTLDTFAVQSDGSLGTVSGPVQTGGSNPDYHSVVVEPDQAPTARLGTAPGGLKAGSPAAFDGSASTDATGAPVARYDWNFGDGTTAPNSGAKPSHTYSKAGTYTVSLTVTDDEGCSNTILYGGQTVYCNGAPSATATETVTVGAGSGGGGGGGGGGGQTHSEQVQSGSGGVKANEVDVPVTCVHPLSGQPSCTGTVTAQFWLPAASASGADFRSAAAAVSDAMHHPHSFQRFSRNFRIARGKTVVVKISLPKRVRRFLKTHDRRRVRVWVTANGRQVASHLLHWRTRHRHHH